MQSGSISSRRSTRVEPTILSLGRPPRWCNRAIRGGCGSGDRVRRTKKITRERELHPQGWFATPAQSGSDDPVEDRLSPNYLRALPRLEDLVRRGERPPLKGVPQESLCIGNVGMFHAAPAGPGGRFSPPHWSIVPILGDYARLTVAVWHESNWLITVQLSPSEM